METMSLDDYRKLVEQVMQDAISGTGKQPRVFSNTGTAHASIVAGTMLDYARTSFAIHCDHLDKDVWDHEKIRSCVERNLSSGMRILVNQSGLPNSALPDLGDLISEGRIEIRMLPYDPEYTPPHLAIADERHIRIERDKASRTAVVAFGNQKLGKGAITLFDVLWQGAKPI